MDANVSVDECVAAIKDSVTWGKKSLNTELAVALTLFAGAGNTDPEIKSVVQGVYLAAGYDCEDSSGRHYKTVNRRLNVCAALYGKLGRRKLEDWMNDKKGPAVIEAVRQGLETNKKFGSMDDVVDYVGRISNRGRPKKDPNAPEVKMTRISAGRVRIEVPEETEPEVLIQLSSKLLELARKKEALMVKASRPVKRPTGRHPGGRSAHLH